MYAWVCKCAMHSVYHYVAPSPMLFYYSHCCSTATAVFGHAKFWFAFFRHFISQINYWIHAVCYCDWNCILFSSLHTDIMHQGVRGTFVRCVFYNAFFVVATLAVRPRFFPPFSLVIIYGIFGIHWIFKKKAVEGGGKRESSKRNWKMVVVVSIHGAPSYLCLHIYIIVYANNFICMCSNQGIK